MTETDPKLAEICKQVEYYFSDSNLPVDRFLRAKTEEDKEGYVDIELLVSFNRLIKLGADVPLIVSAVKSSKLLATDEAGFRIRRTVALPEKSLFPVRGLHVKGWGIKGATPTIEDISKLFSPSGAVLRVSIRKYRDSNKPEDTTRHFRGSAFIEMESAEAAERVAAEDYRVTVQENGKPVEKKLNIEIVQDYFERKKAESKERHQRRGGSHRDRRDTQNGRKGKAEDTPATSNGVDHEEQTNGQAEDVEPNATGKRKRDDTAEEGVEEHAENCKSENVAKDEDGKSENVAKDEDGKSENVAKDEDGKSENVTKDEDGKSENGAKDDDGEEKKVDVVRGVLLKFDGVSGELSREDIREALEVHGDVAYVDFSRGQTSGCVRFSAPTGAKTAFEALKASENNLGLPSGEGVETTFSVLKGQAEDDYLEEAARMRAERMRHSSERNRGRGRGRRGGGRGRGRSGGRGRDRGGGRGGGRGRSWKRSRNDDGGDR